MPLFLFYPPSFIVSLLTPNGRALLEVWTPAADPQPVDGARTFPPDSRLIPEELRDADFIRESNTVPEADFTKAKLPTVTIRAS